MRIKPLWSWVVRQKFALRRPRLNSKAFRLKRRVTETNRRTTHNRRPTTHLLNSPIPFNYLGEVLYRDLEHRLAQRIREFLRGNYGVDLEKLIIEQPPRVELGEYAMPLAFE